VSDVFGTLTSQKSSAVSLPTISNVVPGVKAVMILEFEPGPLLQFVFWWMVRIALTAVCVADGVDASTGVLSGGGLVVSLMTACIVCATMVASPACDDGVATLMLQASAASANMQTPIQSFFIPVPRFLLIDLQKLLRKRMSIRLIAHSKQNDFALFLRAFISFYLKQR